MKKTLRSLLALFLALCMLSAMMVGCTPKDNADDTKPADTKPTDTKPEDTESTEDPLDTSERVDLVFWLTCDEPADIDKIEAKLNEILLEKVNATVTFNFTSYSDTANKASMILSSKEECDLIGAQLWVGFKNFAAKDAYLSLDGLLETYAPGLKALASDAVWDQCRVNGNLYGIPGLIQTYNGEGTLYREDLRKKYDLPVPDTLENMVAYLIGIHENDPDQPLFPHGVSSSSFNNPFGFSGLLDTYDFHDTTGVAGLRYDYNNPQTLYNYWYSDQFREEMKAMKQLADAGIWGKDVLSSPISGDFFDGGAVLRGATTTNLLAGQQIWAESHPDWELGFVDKSELFGWVYPTHPMAAGVAIPLNCKDPGRTLMVLELMYTDKEINNLIYYGIEDDHYTLDEDGLYVEGPNVANYGAGCILSCIKRDVASGIGLQKDSDEQIALTEKYTAIAEKTNSPGVNFKAGFSVDESGYTAEKAACIATSTEYLTPIQAGLVDDVDAAIDEFLEKMEAAGLKKIQDSYMEQWEAYIASMGY